MKKRRGCLFVLSILLCVLALAGCGENSSQSRGVVRGNRVPTAKTESENISDETAQTEEDTKEELYRIININTEQSVVRFEGLESEKEVQYAYTGATYIYDKNEVSRTIDSLYAGMTVTFSVNEQTEKLKEIKASEELWSREGIEGAVIDENAGVITSGLNKYSIAKNVRVFSGNDTIALDQVSVNDTITMIGSEMEVVSIIIENGHGIVKLTNTEKFVGGWVTIGKRISREIIKDMEIEMPEGTYTIAVANAGYGDSTEIMVTRNEILQVNCNELQGEGPKYCELTFEFPQEDVELYLNNEQQDYSKPIELSYGIYQMTLRSEQYGSWSKRLMVSSPSAKITIDLAEVLEAEAEAEEETESESASESSDSSSESSSSNSTTNSSDTTNNSTSNSNTTTNNNTSTSDGTTNSTSSSSSDLVDSDTLSTISNLLDIINGSSSDDD